MTTNEKTPVKSSRVRTDKSLKDERNKTNSVIDSRSDSIEEESDEKTRLNRIATDKSLEHTRAVVDQDLLDERERSDKARIIARKGEDVIRNKERLQKRLIAEALLESERKNTDSKLLEERKRTDIAHDKTKTELITRDQFLAVVSHDLKNSLSSMSLGTGLLRVALSKRIDKDADFFKQLEIIERSVATMDRMISDLLDVERMANDKLLLKTERHNIGELFIECAELFAPVALHKSCSISIEPGADPIRAEIDHDRILQVLSNLIGNALKFSPKGSSF